MTARSALPLAAVLIGLAMICVPMAPTAYADPRTIRIGDASVRYDASRWQAIFSGTSVRFEPQGREMRFIDPVELHVAETGETCESLATSAFAIGAYDTRQLIPSEFRIDGVAGVRISARTGCRNATPLGVAACVRFEKRAYVLQSVQVGCGGGNLFSGIDPIAEIADAIRFEAAER
jgi:hypothetical protein